MSPRPDVSAERKPQILFAAIQVYLRKGFSATRMVDIASEAGLSVGNLYRYFPGKLEITLALMELLLMPSLQTLIDLAVAPGTSRERLESAFLRDFEQQDASALALYSEMYHLAQNEPRVQALLLDYNLKYQGKIAAIVEQGVASGELRPVDPAKTAFTFQAIFDGLMQNRLLMPASLDLSTALRHTFETIFSGLEA